MIKRVGNAAYSNFWVTVEGRQYEPEKNKYEKEQFDVAYPLPLKLREKLEAPLNYCLFCGVVYKLDRPGYMTEEMLLQIWDLQDKERRKFERIKERQNLAGSELKFKRDRIPESVRIEVWRRDEGKCARCGSREKLEMDHIVPVSKGGSNTSRNIELLCQTHNRRKGNKLQ